jgi:hypothetical protein
MDLFGSVGSLVAILWKVFAQQVVQEILLCCDQIVPPAVAHVLDRCGLDLPLELRGPGQLREFQDRRQVSTRRYSGGRASA